MKNWRLLVPGLVLALATMTACGGSGDDGGDAVSASGGGGGGGSGAEPVDAELAFYDCMRENGIDVADPDDNGPQIELPKMDLEDPATQAAYEECRGLLPGGGEAPEYDAEGLSAMREFTACIRENGIDMPDPAADGALAMPEGVDPNSPEFQSAVDACRDVIAGQRVLMGGPR